MKSVTTHEAKTHLSALLKDIEAGEEIQILRGSTPIAKLVSWSSSPQKVVIKKPKVGQITSAPIVFSADSFLPLTDEEIKSWGLG